MAGGPEARATAWRTTAAEHVVTDLETPHIYRILAGDDDQAKGGPLNRMMPAGAGLLAALWVAPAQAQIMEDGVTMMRGYSVMMGGFYELADGKIAAGGQPTPSAVGIRYYERQGIISGLIMGIVTAGAAGVAANQPKSVTTERRGNWVTTTTTYRSEAEKQQILKEGSERAGRIASASNQSFELDLYMTSLPGGGEATGYELNMFFGVPMGDDAMFEFGFGAGEVDSEVTDDQDRRVRLGYRYLGMPFRLNYAVGPAMLWAQWDWNWFGHSDDDHNVEAEDRVIKELRPMTWELGLMTNVLGRVFVEVNANTPALTSGRFGFRGSAGLRF